MLEVIAGLPDNTVGVSAIGQVTGDDYGDILVPLVERKFAGHERLRLLYFLGPEFSKFTTTALWDDTRVGLHHLIGFERIAVCTDVGWIRTMFAGLGKRLPAEVHVFDAADLEAAKGWVGS